jgi:hypothetical protein
MNNFDSKIAPVILMIAVFVIYVLLLRYISPLGSALDKKLYKLTFGRTRLRIFGITFISHYLLVLFIWFLMFLFLFKKGFFDLKILALLVISISLITLVVARINLKKYHKKNLTIFKRTRRED